VEAILGEAKALGRVMSDAKRAQAGTLSINFRGREVPVIANRSGAEQDYVTFLAGSANEFEELKTALKSLLHDANACAQAAIERSKTAGWYTQNSVTSEEAHEYEAGRGASELKAELEQRLASTHQRVATLFNDDVAHANACREWYDTHAVGQQIDSEEDFGGVLVESGNGLAQITETLRVLSVADAREAETYRAKLPLIKATFCQAKHDYISRFGEAAFKERAQEHCQQTPPLFTAPNGEQSDMRPVCARAFAMPCPAR
jgi:hypothetical protein